MMINCESKLGWSGHLSEVIGNIIYPRSMPKAAYTLPNKQQVQGGIWHPIVDAEPLPETRLPIEEDLC